MLTFDSNIKTLLNQEFNNQNVYEVFCNYDLLNSSIINNNIIFYVVLYSEDDEFNFDNILYILDDFENNIFSTFRLSSIAKLDLKKMNKEGQNLIWKEGKWINAN